MFPIIISVTGTQQAHSGYSWKKEADDQQGGGHGWNGQQGREPGVGWDGYSKNKIPTVMGNPRHVQASL